MVELPAYKAEFVDFLLETGALAVGPDRTLKSGRISPTFVNMGQFNSGAQLQRLGREYAQAIDEAGIWCEAVYGIPEKGVGLAPAVAMGFADRGRGDVTYFFTRKVPKGYGEATGTREDALKQVVGGLPEKQDGRPDVVLIDDVITDGATKYEAVEKLKELYGDDGLNLNGLAIAVDRQEVSADDSSAAATFTEKTKVPVVAIVTMSDIYQHLRAKGFDPAALDRVRAYLQIYGTDTALETVGWPQPDGRIIDADRSIIIACDVDDELKPPGAGPDWALEWFERLVGETGDVDGIGGYKVGQDLVLRYGGFRVMETARKHTNRKIIYDHQKGGTDIPEKARGFAQALRDVGFDAGILFPQAGPESERAGIYWLRREGLGVLVGGRMTHQGFSVSEGGWITDEGGDRVYRIAARAGVTNIVVPGNKEELILRAREIYQAAGIRPILWSPGFVKQGGVITKAAKAAGEYFHAIVGTAIVKSPNPRKAAIEMANALRCAA